MAGILLDYDGTIHNALVVYAQAFRKTYIQMQVDGVVTEPKVYCDDDIAKWLGYSVKEMWTEFMPNLETKVWQHYSQMVGTIMQEITQDGGARWYPGAEDMLHTLHAQGHTLVFLSNCRHYYQEMHRSFFKMDRFFDAYYCTEDYTNRSKPEIYTQIRSDFNQDFIVVGDRAVDLAIATTHHLPFIGCAYGYARPGELNDASIIVKTCTDIPKAIANLQF